MLFEHASRTRFSLIEQTLFSTRDFSGDETRNIGGYRRFRRTLSRVFVLLSGIGCIAR